MRDVYSRGNSSRASTGLGPSYRKVEDAARYLDDRGAAVLAALDAFAARHAVPPAAVALACLTAQPTVAAAVASARTIEQLHDLLAAARLKLSADDVELVGGVSAP